MHKLGVSSLGTIGLCLLLTGCMGSGGASPDPSEGSGSARSADAFNPWHQKTLPSSLQLSRDGRDIVRKMGGRAQSIQGEAAHRPYWREEIYPILFGTADAPHEVLVILDFARPQSEQVWKAVETATRSMQKNAARVVVFGKSSELYGTDLTGLMIWIARERKGQAMPYLSYALSRWNTVKAEQKKMGKLKPFANEYDSTARVSDFPIHYYYLSRLKPAVSEEQELQLSRYSYDAGNINAYQAGQICRYYGVDTLPAVIVDGRRLETVTSAAILAALN